MSREWISKKLPSQAEKEGATLDYTMMWLVVSALTKLLALLRCAGVGEWRNSIQKRWVTLGMASATEGGCSLPRELSHLCLHLLRRDAHVVPCTVRWLFSVALRCLIVLSGLSGWGAARSDVSMSSASELLSSRRVTNTAADEMQGVQYAAPLNVDDLAAKPTPAFEASAMLPEVLPAVSNQVCRSAGSRVSKTELIARLLSLPVRSGM